LRRTEIRPPASSTLLGNFDRPTVRAPRPRRRRVFRAGLIVLGCSLVLAVLSAVAALSLRSSLTEGAGLLERGEASLAAGDLRAAEGYFERAQRTFHEAGDGPGPLLLRVEGVVPFLGRTPGAIVDLSAIGERISRAGLDVTRALQRLPGGLSSLGPSRGRIPIERLASLAPAVHGARVLVDDAGRLADRLPEAWLLGPVGEARDLVRAKLGEALPLARSGDALLRALPRFAGADRPRRYFVAAENSAELRGTGGFIGNYAILTVDQGTISLSRFRDIWKLDDVPADSVPAASKEFRTLYDPFGGGGFWANINMTPDAPTAATLIEALYERVEGQRLDGTIFFDIQGLADLLEATGPVQVPELDATVTPDNFVTFVATAQYLDSDIPDAEEVGPRLVADAVWTRFLAGTDPHRSLRALAGAAAGGHLKLHSADPELQDAFRLAGVAGEFGSDGGDFVGVALSNGAANKADFYLHQDVRHEVTLEPGGAARGVTTVTLHNRAPTNSPPSRTLGPTGAAEVGLHLSPGENRWWTSVYCSARCWLADARVDRGDAPLEAHREKGHALFAGFVGAKAGQTATLTATTDRVDVWEGDAASGSYRVRIQGQPLIHPATATVVINAPPGMTVSWTSEPMDVHGASAVWRGTLTSPRELEVRFQKGFLGRAWTRVWNLLMKPALRL
jgi:hypothetical protein